MTFVLDTNVVIYAFDLADRAKHELARRLLEALTTSQGLSLRQVLGEVLNAAHKKRQLSLIDARKVVDLLETSTKVLPTDLIATIEASQLAERYRLQYFDALICTIARKSGASIVFTEDMQDGMRLGTTTIVNPFDPANAALVDEIVVRN